MENHITDWSNSRKQVDCPSIFFTLFKKKITNRKKAHQPFTFVTPKTVPLIL